MSFSISKIEEVYRDGGTLKVKFENQYYYIDRRIGTSTYNVVYRDYPSNTAKIETDSEIILEVLDVIRTDINPDRTYLGYWKFGK